MPEQEQFVLWSAKLQRALIWNPESQQIPTVIQRATSKGWIPFGRGFYPVVTNKAIWRILGIAMMFGNTQIGVQTLPKYHSNSVAYWYKTSKILWVKINSTVDGKHIATPLHGSINAPNITQIALDLSLAKEVLAIETIGARWLNTPSLKMPVIRRNQSLCINLDNWFKLAANVKNKDFYYNYNQNLVFETNSEQRLFKIGLNNEAPKALFYVSACPHLVYGISENALQEIWIISPEEKILP